MSALAHRRLHDPKFLVGHWPLNGHAQDVSGYGNHGTWSGTAAYATGPYNGKTVGSLNGASSIALGTVPGFAGGFSGFTAAIWNKPTSSVAGVQRLLTREFGYTIYNFDGLLSCAVYKTPGGTNNRWVISSIPGFVPNVWSYCAMTFVGTTLIVYLNGVFYASNTASTTEAGAQTGDFIGSNAAGSQRFTGQTHNARLYNIALTGDEVAALYEYDTR